MKKIILFTAMILTATLGMSQYASNGYYGNQGGNNSNSYGNNHSPPAMAMSNNEFNQAMMQVRRQRFESGKLSVAKQVASRNLMKSGQVKRMTMSFNFESTRLEFAKFAYSSVINPQRYYVVNEAFRFNSSARNLERFIGTQSITAHNTYTSSNGGYSSGNSNYGVNSGATGYNSGSTGYNSGGSSCGSTGTMTYSGSVSTTPVGPPACSMCNGHHVQNHFCEMNLGKIIRSIKKKCFDDDKLSIAKQAMHGGSMMLSSDQVLRIMNLFTFEDTKLRFAKFAYHHTWDKRNYFVVNDGFTFNSSIHDLERFIRRV